MADNNKKYATQDQLGGGDNYSTVTSTTINSNIDTTYFISGYSGTYTFKLPATIPSDGKMHSVSLITRSASVGASFVGNGRSVYYTTRINAQSTAQFVVFTFSTSSDMTFWYGIWYQVG